ncbi:MAG: hypothetical protein LBI71_04010 [Enterobacteriaceae bacterium]|nr:hypothetical protein [Enterobacteriaceae bacterium]
MSLFEQKRSNGVRRNVQSNNLWAVGCNLLDWVKPVLICALRVSRCVAAARV